MSVLFIYIFCFVHLAFLYIEKKYKNSFLVLLYALTLPYELSMLCELCKPYEYFMNHLKSFATA